MKKLWIGVALVVGVVVIAVVGVLLASEFGGEVVIVTTFDDRGEPHETRLWVVDYGPEPWLRAGNPEASWLANIRNFAEVEMERRGFSARFQALTEADPNTATRIDRLMAQKYGIADQVIGLMRGGTSPVPVRLRYIAPEREPAETDGDAEPVAGAPKAEPATVSSESAVFDAIGSLQGGLLPGRALAVSGDGRVVVGSSNSTQGIEAFRWEAGELTALGDLPGGGFSSQAIAISRDGRVIVGRGQSARGTEAVRWSDGQMSSLGDLEGDSFFSIATGVSDDGEVIVGRGTSASGVEAFRWQAGRMQGLGDLPGESFDSVALGVSGDGATVVGVAEGKRGREAFRWRDGAMAGLGKLADGRRWTSAAMAVSRNGAVVVGETSTPEGTVAFRWVDGEMTSLGDPAPIRADLDSVALAVSADGTTVVGRSFAMPDGGAFIWDEAGGIRSIQDMLQKVHGIVLPGWSLDAAEGVSDDGRVIVGFGTNPDGVTQPWRVELLETAADVAEDGEAAPAS